jgi:hypothetical protein
MSNMCIRTISTDRIHCDVCLVNRRNFVDKPYRKNITTDVILMLNSPRLHKLIMRRRHWACHCHRPARASRLSIDEKRSKHVKIYFFMPKKVRNYAHVRRRRIRIVFYFIVIRTTRPYEPMVSACALSADKNAKTAV